MRATQTTVGVSMKLEILKNSELTISKFKSDYDSDREEDLFRNAINLRDLLYQTISQPSFNIFSYTYSTINILAILASIISFLMSSLTEYRDYQDDQSFVLNVVELTCVAVFTFDYLARFALTRRNKVVHVLSLLNMIDLLAIVPSYVELLLEAKGIGALVVVRILRLFRIFRLLKVAKYSKQLPILMKSIHNSVGGFAVGIFSLFMSLILWASAIYYAETVFCSLDPTDNTWKYDDGTLSDFQSIPDSLWWTIVTMCTVGYGDTYPITYAGKAIATVVMVSGVLVLAFPLTILAGNFMTEWNEFLVKEEKKSLKRWEKSFRRIVKEAEMKGEEQVEGMMPRPRKLLEEVWDDLLTLKSNVDACERAIHTVKIQIKKLDLLIQQLDISVKLTELERNEVAKKEDVGGSEVGEKGKVSYEIR
eukprot:TRINITY_DN3647_c0_g4_i1.p1 TRINITY_DN3647_c0_g4~~TRINITY_DN3647_c0_g4_i1.p1  ORF type:complete len:442 (-),score=79.21 TRINITY_DN3647_c0_g4_i1:49-1311(-)